MGGRGSSQKERYERQVLDKTERQRRSAQYYNDFDDLIRSINDPLNAVFDTPYVPDQCPIPVSIPSSLNPTALEQNFIATTFERLQQTLDDLEATLSTWPQDVLNAFTDGIKGLMPDWPQLPFDPSDYDVIAELHRRWEAVPNEDKVIVMMDLISISTLFIAPELSPGFTLYARVPLTAFITSLVTRTENSVVDRLSWTEAHKSYIKAEIAAEKLGVPIPQLNLLSPSKLSQLNITELEAELSRSALLIHSDLTVNYQRTLSAMLAREQALLAGQKPILDPKLPPSTYTTPDVDLSRMESRITTPPDTPNENVAVAITHPLKTTIPPLSPEALAAQRAQDASLAGQPISVTGSRSIPDHLQDQVNRIAAALARAKCSITTGCATGIDEAFVPYASKINAQFGPNGEGKISASNVEGVKNAELNGVPVNYYAGGDLGVHVKARLVNRARLTATDSPNLLAIITQETSVGTVNTMRTAAENHKNIHAIHLEGGPLPVLNNKGHWQKVENAKGIWDGLHRWIPDD